MLRPAVLARVRLLTATEIAGVRLRDVGPVPGADLAAVPDGVDRLVGWLRWFTPQDEHRPSWPYLLSGLSAWRLAQHLQAGHVRDAFAGVPAVGLEVLAATDATAELHGVEVRLGALTADRRAYRSGVRLRDRLRELGGP